MKYILFTLISFSFLSVNSQIPFTEIYHAYDTLDFVNEALHGDLNGDEMVDFVLVSYGADKIRIGINDTLQQPEFVTISTGMDVRNVALHDIDQDNDLDIIGSLIFDNISYCWKNDGNGNFTPTSLPIVDYASIDFADIDDDGEAEMILGIDGQLNIYDITGGTVTLLATVVDDSFLGMPAAIDILDYNEDNLLDIAGVFNSDGVRVFQQSGGLNFTQIDILPESFNNAKRGL